MLRACLTQGHGPARAADPGAPHARGPRFACAALCVRDRSDRDLTGSPITQHPRRRRRRAKRDLNQATANATGRRVLAGPAEATAGGNVVVQAIACGEVRSLADGRAVVARSVRAKPYEPQHAREWERARERYQQVAAASSS